jgi:CheY-like chemotaxis protein
MQTTPNLSFARWRNTGSQTGCITFLDGQSALDYLFQRGEYSDPARATSARDPAGPAPAASGRYGCSQTIKENDNLKTIPVVVLTTSEAEKDVAKAYYNHANSYLVKPVGFEEFKQLMDDLGFYWLSWNTNPG